jgi:predicted secreted acid phosphatase
MHLLALLESGQWYREVRLVLKVGRRFLRTVLPREHSVVVFDVDDTALSSVVYMARTHFARHPSASPDWYHCACVPALLPVLEFYHIVLHLGFSVVFISERPATAFHQTKEALVRAGFTTFKHLITRPPPEKALAGGAPRGSTGAAVKMKAEMRAGQFKYESREALVAQGMDIVATVGDQDSDFAGGVHGMPVKLPNYLYMEE